MVSVSPDVDREGVAALGLSLLAGVGLVLPLLILLLVLGVPVNLVSAGLVCLACVTASELIARRRARTTQIVHASKRAASAGGAWLRRVALLVAGAYFAFGAFALARLPTMSDDARIWSLRGLTLAHYHGLQPEIFQNPSQSGAHPIYPLFQPVLEALVSQAMGGPQLRFFHAELWLLFAGAIWAATYLILRAMPRLEGVVPIWIAPLVLLSLTPAALDNLVSGYADITGRVILATGSLALALWLDRGELGSLGLGVVLLAAAANTKDEDLVAAVLLLVVAIVFDLARARGAPQRLHRLRLAGGAALCFAVLVLPWRVWTARHHLSDSVEPRIPHALSPAYIFGRTHQLSQTVTSMVRQTLGEWHWLAAVFIVACVICIAARTGRRVAGFYLASVLVIVVSLLWLYTTTPVNLGFLLRTSMDRTVDLFMVPAAMATAHLLAYMQRGGPSESATQPTGRPQSVEDDLVESRPSVHSRARSAADE